MTDTALPIAGWHEEVQLRELGIEKAFAKLDTGADRSTLHARDINIVGAGAARRVEFTAPLLRRQDSCAQWPRGGVRRVSAPLVEERVVRSSNGAEEKRVVIATMLKLGDAEFTTRFTLTSREGLRFPLLIGRDALKGRFLVDAEKAHRLVAAASTECPDHS